jgi:hypothetical protein
MTAGVPEVTLAGQRRQAAGSLLGAGFPNWFTAQSGTSDRNE